MQLVFTVFDSKAKAYLNPFYMTSFGAAERLFGDMCNEPEHQFHKHPEDFTLFSLGEFNDNNGQFITSETPKPIAKALQYKKD